MSNETLYRSILEGKEFDKFIFKAKCKKMNTGKGNTLYSVQKMSDVVEQHSSQIKALAKLLQQRSLNLSELAQNIQDFLYWHIQYKEDQADQLLRSPSCSWKERETGVDCKSYSIFAASILKELGYKSYFRRVSYGPGEPYKHVYVVVPLDQDTKNPDLKNKYSYLFIDGTINRNVNALFEPFYYKNHDFMSYELDHYTLAKPGLGNPNSDNWHSVIGSKLPNKQGLGFIPVGAIAAGAAASATQAGNSLISNATTSATNAATNAAGNIVSSVTGGIMNFIGGIFSGPTGAAGVDMENERKVGDQYFHMAKIGGKWRDFDHVLKTMGKGGLEAYGWGFGKVPRSAQKIFKQAEDAFFSVLKPFLDQVAAGQAQYPDSFLNDPIMMTYLENRMKPVTTPGTTSVTTPKTSSTPKTLTVVGASKSPAITSNVQPTTKKAGGGIVGILLTAAALGTAVYGFSATKPKKVKM
jgi:hypothetical protein